MHHRHEAGLLRNRRLKGVHVQASIIQNWDNLELHPCAALQELPRYNIRVMLHPRNQHLVTGLEPGRREAPRHEVDGFCGAPHEHNLFGFLRVDKGPQLLPRAFVGVRSPLAQQVHPAMDICPIMELEVGYGVQRRPTDLPRGCVVEVDKVLPMHFLMKPGEVLTNGLDVQPRRR